MDARVALLLDRIAETGFGTGYMSAEHKHLGARMRERVGLVADWVAGLSHGRLRDLDATLRGMERAGRKLPNFRTRVIR